MSSILSILISAPEWLLKLLGEHYQVVIGYFICVLFPIPWLNSFIISLWAKLLTAPVISNVATATSTVINDVEADIKPSSGNVSI